MPSAVTPQPALRPDTAAVHAGREDLRALGVHVPPVDLSTTNPLPGVEPGGESYEMVSARMRDWYGSLVHDTVVTAHGGTARGLIAILGIAKPAAAPLLDIEQGMIYVFEGETLTRYS